MTIATNQSAGIANMSNRDVLLELERLRVSGEKKLVIWRACLDLAQNALKTVILVNGAAVVSIIAFAETRGLTNSLEYGALLFAFGVALGVVASFMAYLSQYEVLMNSEETDGIVFSRRGKRLAGIVACFMSLACFLAGVYLSVQGIHSN